MWLFPLIFVIDFVVSFAWANCVKAISNDKPSNAGLWSGFITLAGAITVIGYTQNHWLLIPAVLGSSLGTYLSVKNRV